MQICEEVQSSLILYNGRVHTVDDHDEVVSAVAIAGDRILATGEDAEILALAGSQTETRDLRGRSVIPGIIDSHNHAWEAGRLMEGVVTFGVRSIEELKQKLKEKARELSPGSWLQGGGWIETQFEERRMPNRWDLDEAVPEHPVVVERIFSTSVANSAALAIAGITRDTPDPEAGEIERHPETGEPTGVLHRSAKMLVRRHIPFGDESSGLTEGAAEAIFRACCEYLRWGITSVVEPGVTPSLSRAYQDLWQKGELPLRVCLMPNWYGFQLEHDEDRMDRVTEALGIYTGIGDEWLRLGALKMAVDGGLTSKTALLSWPYLGEDRPREVPLRLDLSRLKGLVLRAHQAGWSVGIHVVGDVSQDAAVEAIWEACQADPRPHRHQVIHGYYPTEQSLQRMAEAGIIAAVQPSFTYGEADGYSDLLSRDKQESFLPLKSYLEAGVCVAISTDMPSAHFNPFWGLYSAVTRRGLAGYSLGEAESIDVEQGLRMMTLNSAHLTGEEEIKGSLEPGKLADLAVLDRDLLVTPSAKIRDTVVELTVIGGRVVFDRHKGWE